MDRNMFEQLDSDESSDDIESKALFFQNDSQVKILAVDKIAEESLCQKYPGSEGYQFGTYNLGEETRENSQRTSVIRSIQSPFLESDGENSSGGSSLVLDEESDAPEDTSLPKDHEPSDLKSAHCGSVPLECSVCQKILGSKRALSIHTRMKHFGSNSVGFLCRICKKRFDSKSERTHHYATDHQGDSPFACTICNKGFASKSGMYGHRQTHIKTSVSKCKFCGKEFSRKDSYNEHLLIHNGPRHKCPHCDKEFVQRSNLVRHIRIHTGEKPYKCSFCVKTFSDKGACNSHVRVHTREEACSCPYCGQIFSKKQKLKYHIRKHTGEDLVSCEFCGKAFTNSHSLKEHRMIHDHRTQLLCSQCGKAFSTAKYLQRHIAMIHEATLLYKCPLCSRRFNQQARLKNHLMTHTGIKHLQCLLCNKAYSTRKSLRHHLLNMHSITTEHPDYKQYFYAITPEEAGVKISEELQFSKQRFVRLKSEPQFGDSDSDVVEENDDDSEDGNDSSNEPPTLCQTAISMSSTPNPPSFPYIRTKAAMKQLPFNVVSTENRVVFTSKGSEGSLEIESEKPIKHKRIKSRAQKPDNHKLAHFNSESTSTSLSIIMTSKTSKETKPKKTSTDCTGGTSLTRLKRKQDSKTRAGLNSSQFSSVRQRSSDHHTSSNQRAKYKQQTPKKRSPKGFANVD